MALAPKVHFADFVLNTATVFKLFNTDRSASVKNESFAWLSVFFFYFSLKRVSSSINTRVRPKN